MRSWKKLAWATAIAVVGGLAWLANDRFDYVYVTVPNAYAVWRVADLVIKYMDDHAGAWPQQWNDLRESHQRLGGPWTFEQLRNRVEVDWKADPAVLKKSEPADDKPPFHVIWLRDGSKVYWKGREPNRLVWEYLQQVAK